MVTKNQRGSQRTSRKSLDLGSFAFDHGNSSTSPKGESKKLTWSIVPEENFSDWTIIVKTKDRNSAPKENKESTTAYHVHKNFLGANERNSQYFVRLFHTEGLAESNSSTSTIDLEASAAAAFPAMLDFIYSIVEHCDASTESAVALRYLASYFGIETLFNDVNEFIQHDLSASTAPIYLEEAKLYHDEKILVAATNICASEIQDINETILTDLTPDLFQRIVTCPELFCPSEVLSALVGSYCKNQPSHMITKELLDSLTDPAKMPDIDPNSAMFLLQQSIKYSLDESSQDGSSLQNRCVKAISDSWKEVLRESIMVGVGNNTISDDQQVESNGENTKKRKRTQATSDYDNIPSDVKVRLLESALDSAHSEVTRQLTNVDQMHSKNQSLQNDVTQKKRIIMNLKSRVSSLEKSIVSKQSTISELTEKVSEKEAEVKKLNKYPHW